MVCPTPAADGKIYWGVAFVSFCASIFRLPQGLPFPQQRVNWSLWERERQGNSSPSLGKAPPHKLPAILPVKLGRFKVEERTEQLV